jgi:hypothetical protein
MFAVSAVFIPESGKFSRFFWLATIRKIFTAIRKIFTAIRKIFTADDEKG